MAARSSSSKSIPPTSGAGQTMAHEGAARTVPPATRVPGEDTSALLPPLAGSHGGASAGSAALAGELRIVLGRMKRRLREQTDLGGITWAQAGVLTYLEREGPATVTMLARVEGVRPQSMGATIAMFEAAGLVAGVPHPSDGRQTLLSITPACREWLVNRRAVGQDWIAHAIDARLNPAEQQQLAAAVDLLKRLADA